MFKFSDVRNQGILDPYFWDTKLHFCEVCVFSVLQHISCYVFLCPSVGILKGESFFCFARNRKIREYPAKDG